MQVHRSMQAQTGPFQRQEFLHVHSNLGQDQAGWYVRPPGGRMVVDQSRIDRNRAMEPRFGPTVPASEHGRA
jgi:hypothetical protein